MTSIVSVNRSALLLLQPRISPATEIDDQHAAGDTIVAIANGVSVEQSLGSRRAPAQAQAVISEALFSVNRPNMVKLKMNLIDRAGEALGIDRDRFPLEVEYGRAVHQAFLDLALKPKGLEAIKKIERDLGLDKLGISLKTVVDAIGNALGAADAALERALKEQSEKDRGDAVSNPLPFTPQTDDLGIYGSAPAATSGLVVS